jgi:hypothetical protein
MPKVKIKQVNIGPVSGTNVVPVWTGSEFDDTPITVDFGLNEVNVSGDFSATTKRFLIDHPTKPGFKLQHGNLEGPEHGVYLRGKSTTKKISLPEYWTGLVDPNSITITLTPVGRHQNLYVKKISKTFIEIAGAHKIEFFYLIQATRKDVAPLQIELDRRPIDSDK